MLRLGVPCEINSAHLVREFRDLYFPGGYALWLASVKHAGICSVPTYSWFHIYTLIG